MIYFVSTPIGNLEDITFRAVNTLKNVDIIACEDTRTSQKLLNHYNISKKLISFHKFNEASSCEKIIELNNEGKNIAIITDAGTPIISDPGNILTKILRERAIQFTIIPGANAAISALVLSGLDAASFLFSGFLPEKKSERTSLLNELSLIKSTLIFYISPHSLKKDLIDIKTTFGNRKCALVNEITKMYEKVYSFNLNDEIFIKTPDILNPPEDNIIIDSRGEFVLVVDGAKDNSEELLKKDIPDHVKFYINLGLSKNDAIKKVAHERKVKKDTIYREVLNL
ncbi:MAG: 16S rRNA (cytidine(1402)-2'-O)-methyltransferase [Clostridia bacterium]|nr:16S rRNA (cytidine(1402)-2'-O)-methyltransferase [Clostridia bacterium]